MTTPVPESPEWWRDRLYKQLTERRPRIDRLDEWYRGDHIPPAVYDKARELLKRLLEMTNTNFLQLVVDAAAERMHVEGFRLGDQAASDAAWRIWQGNNFDLGSEMVFLDCLALGEASVLVDPELNANGVPTLTPEHPSQTIVEYRPGSFHERMAGLKCWKDDVANVLMATVYLPDRVDTWQAPLLKQGSVAQRPSWEHQSSISGVNPLGEVPLIDFRNRPRMLRSGSSEFYSVIPVQKRINKTVLDRLVMQEYGAFRQKWASGIEIPEDENGNPVEPFQSAIDRMFVSEQEGAKFGTFDSDDISKLLAGIDADVKHMAAIVPTPPHYLLGGMVNLSAEALKASEASLVSRVRGHMRHIEEPLETVVRLSLKAAGGPVPDAGTETIWRNPEFRTEGELVDALVKMRTLGVPLEMLWERYGMSPQEIKRAQQLREQEALDPLTQRLLAGGSTEGQSVPGTDDAGLG